MSYIEKEKLIKADMASIENRVRHAFNQGYDLGFKDGKEKAKPLEQEPQTFKWCDTCKEYDQEKHCCHRWSKVIRDTVEEMKQEQEPILDKIFCIVHPLSIMSTPELEHKAIMQIAEMLEPLCLPEGEDKE